MMNESTSESHVKDRRPRRYLSDSFYLVLAAAGLFQVPRTIDASGPWIGILFALVIVIFTVLIAVGNRNRFLPMLSNRYKD
ncbi:hypothetical protein AL755_04245 [Arthrobacter sp. ERGS1:01]|nr:hypothetical protein AL755_04245 [Arthrobacter sp. ERGS1:01]